MYTDHRDPIAMLPIGFAPDSERVRLKILSYNIQVGIAAQRYRHYLTNSWKHFLPYGGRLDNLDSIARFINAFDIVGLQELDAGSLRSNFINLAEYLAQRAAFPHWYHRTNRNLGQLAKHSLGLLSRYQPHTVIAHKLPSSIPGRGALEAHFGNPYTGQTLVVVLVHLSLGRRSRRMQLEYIAEVLREHQHVVVMGDMNTPAHSTEIQRLLYTTGLQSPSTLSNTYPSWRPQQALDYILCTPGLEITQARAYNVNYSDHLPISVEILLPAEFSLSDTASLATRVPPPSYMDSRYA
nr:endonuclease/exonuclease/phosphatase family protein [Thiorhodospira sibirica]